MARNYSSYNNNRNAYYSSMNMSSNTSRKKMMAAWSMIALSILGIVLSVFFIVGPKNSDRIGIDTYVGWSEAWDSRPEYKQDFAGGDGSASNPFLINNAQQMANFAYYINQWNPDQTNHSASFKLTNDIDMSMRRWNPIGRFEYERVFKGTFDGDGHVLSGVASENDYERNNNRYAGLFGIVGENATIKNLKLNNNSINFTHHSDEAPDYNDNSGGLTGGLVAAYVMKDSNVTIMNVEVNSGRVNINAGDWSDRKTDAGYDLGGILGATSSYGTQTHVMIKDVKVRNTILNAAMENDNWYRGNNMGLVAGKIQGMSEISNVSLSGNDLISSNTTASNDGNFKPVNGGIRDNATHVGGVVGRISNDTHDTIANNNSYISDVTMTGTRFQVVGSDELNVAGVVGYGGYLNATRINNVTIEDGVTMKVMSANSQNEKGVFVGGIMANANGDRGSLYMDNVNFEGTINASAYGNSKRHAHAGGIMGRVQFGDVKLSNSSADVDITMGGGEYRAAAGIIGAASTSSTGGSSSKLAIENVVAVGSVASTGGSTINGGAIGEMTTTGVSSLTNVVTAMDGLNNNDKLVGQGDVQSTDEASMQMEVPTPVVGDITVTKSDKDKDGNIKDKADENLSDNQIIKGESFTLSANLLTQSMKLDGEDIEEPTDPTDPEEPDTEAPEETKPPVDTEITTSFEWYTSVDGTNKNGKRLGGIDGATLVLNAGQLGTQQYYVKAVNSFNGVRRVGVSGVVTVEVVKDDVTPPTITKQPVLEALQIGNTSNDSKWVETTGSVKLDQRARIQVRAEAPKGNLSYQWYSSTQPIDGDTLNNGSKPEGGSLIAGATEMVFDVPTLNPTTVYYFVEVISTESDARTASTFSGSVMVNVSSLEGPYITSNLPDYSAQDIDNVIHASINTNVVLSITAKAADDEFSSLSYKWYTSPDANKTFAEFSPENSPRIQDSKKDTGIWYYYVIVTAKAGNETTKSQSNIAMVSYEKPKIDAPKVTIYKTESETNTSEWTLSSAFNPQPSSNLTPSYQWYESDNYNNTAGRAIIGETSETLVVALTDYEKHYYYLIVTFTDEYGQTEERKSNPEEIQRNGGIAPNSQFLNGNLPWVIVIVGSAGVMFAAFVLLVKRTVVEY